MRDVVYPAKKPKNKKGTEVENTDTWNYTGL